MSGNITVKRLIYMTRLASEDYNWCVKIKNASIYKQYLEEMIRV